MHLSSKSETYTAIENTDFSEVKFLRSFLPSKSSENIELNQLNPAINMGEFFVISSGIVSNIVSVVGIVICLKYITKEDKYDFMIFLSALHFFFTAAGTRLLLWLDFFQYSSAPMSSVLPLAIGSLLSVAFMNLSLSHSSVGFYQLSKLACIPFTLLVQYLIYKTSTSRAVLITLIPISFGVGYATIYDFEVNFLSLIFATCAVSSTSMAQIFTNTYQKTLDCNALQLLYHTSPIIAMGMLVMSPFFDNFSNLFAYQYSWGCIFRIVLSCVFALVVNISNYVVLGKTSPLTYQVLGHLKTVLILILGFTVFHKPINRQNLIGIVIAMIGVIAYTEIKRKEASGSKVAVASGSFASPSGVLGTPTKSMEKFKKMEIGET